MNSPLNKKVFMRCPVCWKTRSPFHTVLAIPDTHFMSSIAEIYELKSLCGSGILIPNSFFHIPAGCALTPSMWCLGLKENIDHCLGLKEYIISVVCLTLQATTFSHITAAMWESAWQASKFKASILKHNSSVQCMLFWRHRMERKEKCARLWVLFAR